MGFRKGAARMEIIRSVELISGKIRILFESGWIVWLKRNEDPGFPLTEGTAVERKSFTKFILLHQYPSALNAAVRMLAQRPCSRKEIEMHLTGARYSEETTEMVLYKLDQDHLLNDRDFAEQWVQSRSRKYGNNRIQQELRAKGIDSETAADVLNHISEETQTENATAFAARKIHSLKGTCETGRMKQRIIASVVRRGYTWNTAIKAFEEALRLENENRH